jgi:hypothetical protein
MSSLTRLQAFESFLVSERKEKSTVLKATFKYAWWFILTQMYSYAPGGEKKRGGRPGNLC